MLKPKLNRWGEVEPRVGEIWQDKLGHRNLVTKVYKEDGKKYAQLLTLETGEAWPTESFDGWQKNYEDAQPFYRILVA